MVARAAAAKAGAREVEAMGVAVRAAEVRAEVKGAAARVEAAMEGVTAVAEKAEDWVATFA